MCRPLVKTIAKHHANERIDLALRNLEMIVSLHADELRVPHVRSAIGEMERCARPVPEYSADTELAFYRIFVVHTDRYVVIGKVQSHRYPHELGPFTVKLRPAGARRNKQKR